MSLYNLENQTVLSYYAKHQERLLVLSDKEYIYNYFLAGKKINKKEQRFSFIMEEILKTQNCELINYINDKLKVNLETSCKVKSTEKPIVVYNITQIIEKKMEWENDTQF